MPRLIQTALALAVFSLPACAMDAQTGPTSGGGKEDSFGSPTEHGELRFASPNRGDFTNIENFHSWTFELTGSADIDLTTEVAFNLDTVMYLYRRDPGTSSWGENIEKNDDHGDSLGSRITLANAAPGEYRVKVKATKIQQRGDFTLNATCDGAGCPTNEVGSFEPLPPEGLSEFCYRDFVDAIGAPITTSSGVQDVEFPDPDLSLLTPLETKALGHYIDYWDEINGFSDMFDDPTVEISVDTSSNGSVVRVDAGGDEAAMDLVYNRDGELLMLYQHNQSPDARYYCSDSEPNIDAPNEECSRELLSSMQHHSESSSEIETTLNEVDSLNLDPKVRRAIQAFEDDNFLDPDESFMVFAGTWDEGGDSKGAEVAFDGPAISTYFVSQDFDDDLHVLTHINEEGETFVICEGL